MRFRSSRTILCLFLLFAGYANALFAQHYIFIEAEGQQPFYLKSKGETYSSNGSGFIILSRINAKELDLVIGFPNKLYPEVAFKLSTVEKDRGFYLKRLENKGWVLLDRSSMELIAGNAVDAKPASAVEQSVGSSSFAQLLSETTGDKSLLEKSWSTSLSQSKPSNLTGTKPKSVVVTTKPAAPKPSVTPAMALPSIKSFIKTNNDNAIQIVYVEKGLKGKTDTILVEIDKTKKAQPEISPVAVIESKIKDSVQANKVDVVQPALSMEMQAPKAVDCTNPIAMPKDMRELQRKMGRASSDAEQVELVVKAFGEKCFTCKQTKELGLYFLDEQKRLDFYSRVRNLVSDPALFGELEQTFLKEENIKAFRAILKQQSR